MNLFLFAGDGVVQGDDGLASEEVVRGDLAVAVGSKGAEEGVVAEERI